MSKEELINEILAAKRVELEAKDIKELKLDVINMRTGNYRDEMIKEAGFKAVNGPMGLTLLGEDDE